MREAPGRAVAAVLASALLVAGCGIPTATGRDGQTGRPAVTTDADGFHGTLMEPARPRPDVELPTTAGESFDLADRPEDEVTVLLFGYTHCPDLCPTTMADLARARGMLEGDLRERVEVVFVTEDPARDTPELLRDWLDRFDPDFTGLIGGNEATAAALTELYLPETGRVDDPSADITHPHGAEDHDHGDYGVDHAGIVYAWGPGERSVIYTGGTTPEQYAEDLTRLAADG